MNILIIDTETANSIEQPLPYDIGYAIINTETKQVLVERSFIVYEIFFDKDLMNSAYYAEKVPKYLEDIEAGTRIIKRLNTIRNIVNDDMKKYNVKNVGAYNMPFDKRATNNDTRYLTSSSLRWFFPYDTEYFCIWRMACTSILNNDYIKFAIENGMVSEKGNIKTSAECVYRYITKNVDFEESHTGLEDVHIETEIYFAVIESGLSYECEPKANCWQTVQKVRKNMEKEGEI